MNYFVSIIQGPNAGRRRHLAESASLVIGRGDECDLRLNDPSVSRIHARITLSQGRVSVEDAGSRWGTLVNGFSTDCHTLVPGDRIEIGDTHLRLEADSLIATTISPIGRRSLGELATLARKGLGLFGKGRLAETESAGSLAPRSRSAIEPEALVGKRFFRFQVESVVAEARTGIVFRARDSKHDRTVALKIFHPRFWQDCASQRRFLRAVRATIPLNHENLVRLYTAGRTAGLCFTASEFVVGESLSQTVGRVGVAGMLNWPSAWHVACGVADALAVAHEHGILHRNLGPGNILIRSADHCVKLGDLSLAKAFDSTGDERITRPGEVVGCLSSLSPEQLSGEQPVDARSDIYSLGATLYLILTGRPPFAGGTAAEVIRRIVSRAPEPPTNFHLAIPSPFEGLVLRMLSVRPEDRPANARELRKDLDQIGRLRNLSAAIE